MGSDDSRIYFPLRSNALAFVRGAPIEALRRRMKLASLMFDSVVLEYGVTQIMAGPGGAYVTTNFPSPDDDLVSWQTAAERRPRDGRTFSLRMAPEESPGIGAPGPFHSVIQSPVGVNWRATFLPFRPEVPIDADWLQFAFPPELPRELERKASDWARRDARFGDLRDLDRFSLSTVAKHSAKDFFAGTAAGAPVSMDRVHAHALLSRAPGGLAADFSLVVLNTLVPRVNQLSWEQIAALRTSENVRYWRATLQEIAVAIREEAAAGRDAEALTRERYAQMLSRANIRAHEAFGALSPSLLGLAAGIGTDLALQMAGVEPSLAGSALGLAAGIGYDSYLRRRDRRWLAADGLIRNMANGGSEPPV